MRDGPHHPLSGLLIALLCGATPALAGDWHSGESLLCSDCHTMHNSSGGQPMRYDEASAPAPHLLRHVSTVSLCVYCHDGTNLAAPDVISPVTYAPDPAGGEFANSGGTATNRGHDLGMVAGQVPPGGSTAVVLTCTTCHDYHGNSNYRNLRPDPAQTGANIAVSTGSTVAPDGNNPAAVYVPSNLVDRFGMSEWCGACHGEFHGRTPSEEGTSSPWFRHPQDQAIAGAIHADYSWWQTPQTPRVRVISPSDSVVPSADDRVVCLSCHKAHGSANTAARVFADASTQRSTCQQCHHE